MNAYIVTIDGVRSIMSAKNSVDLFFELRKNNKSVKVEPLNETKKKRLNSDVKKALDLELNYKTRKNWYNKTH